MSSPANSPTSDNEQSRSKSLSTSSSMSTPNMLHEGTSEKRKSAFLPYRPHATVLTNLQRGNTEATFCPVEVTLSFHERAGQGEITSEQVHQEIDRHEKELGPNAIDFTDAHGFTALHWAAYYGQLDAVQLLLSAGANVNAEANELVTPLLLAASGGHNEIVRLLLDRGAHASHMDIIGNTALMYAAAGNHPHTCNELLSRDPDMTASNEDGDTAYTLAVEHGATLAQSILEHYLSAILTL